MMLAAAQALGEISPGLSDAGGALLPPLEALPGLVPRIALRVAMEAVRAGVAPSLDADTLHLRIDEKRWVPAYVPVLPAD